MGVDEGIVVLVMSMAGDKGGNREVTSKPLPFVNAPPEGCVWEQWGRFRCSLGSGGRCQ